MVERPGLHLLRAAQQILNFITSLVAQYRNQSAVLSVVVRMWLYMQCSDSNIHSTV